MREDITDLMTPDTVALSQVVADLVKDALIRLGLGTPLQGTLDLSDASLIEAANKIRGRGIVIAPNVIDLKHATDLRERPRRIGPIILVANNRHYDRAIATLQGGQVALGLEMFMTAYLSAYGLDPYDTDVGDMYEFPEYSFL